MLPICYICLRSYPKLRTLGDHLEDLFDDLSDYLRENDVQFCTICSAKMKKFYEFKKQCELAAKTLKAWRKQKSFEKPLINELYTKVPGLESQLGLSTRKNFKVYFCHSSDVSTSTIQTYTSHPNILSVNIPRDGDTETIENEPPLLDADTDIKPENNVKIKVEVVDSDVGLENFNTDDADSNTQYLSDKEYPSDCDSISEIINKYNVERRKRSKNDDFSNESDKEFQSDSDIALNEIIKSVSKQKKGKRKKSSKNDDIENESKTIITDENERKVKRKKYKIQKSFDREDLKRQLRRKFEINGVVKDHKGNIIDVEVILNSIDKVANINLLKNLSNLILGPGPFKALAIQKLSKLHEHFTEYDSVFTTEYISDQAQIQVEFERRRECSNYVRLSKYRCEKCIRGFINPKLLDIHNKTKHNESLQFECSLCHMWYKERRDFLRHVAGHSTVYHCKLCPDFVTSNRSSMIAHYNRHKGLKYACENGCGIEFKNKASLYTHYNEKCPKTSKSRYICELCARSFVKDVGLKQHKYLKHKGEEFVQGSDNVKCEECNIIFITNDVYNKHMNVTHKSVDGVKDKKFICRLCKSEGTNSFWLAKHFAKDHPNENMSLWYNKRKYLCDLCGRVFCNASFYNDHLNTHASLRPYQCSSCPKRFATKALLRVHTESHNPPTRECKQCGKMLTTASGLYRHYKSHIGERRYVCEICGKGFNHSDSLKAHVNGVHYNIRPVRKRKRGVLTE